MWKEAERGSTGGVMTATPACLPVYHAEMDLRAIAPNLELTDRGWWASPARGEVSYPDEGHALCFALEDASFWFRHRNRCILALLDRFPPAGAFFDVGGGNGCVAFAIQESGRDVVLVEPGLIGVENAVRRGVKHVVQATFEGVGLHDNSVAAVGLFDVVEHIGEDEAFLERVRSLLKPQGRVYLTVPAYTWLWSHEDRLAGHHRRYTLSSLSRLFEATGFHVEFATYFFGFLPLPVLVSRALPFRLGVPPRPLSEDAARSDHQVSHSLSARLLEGLTRRELGRIVNLRPAAWGSSCLAVAQKRD